MKRVQLTYLFVILLSTGLITACNKSKDVAPVSPIVGQFNIQRVEVTDIVPTTLGYKTPIIDSTNLNPDIYVFNADLTYVNSFTNSNGPGAETGTWVYTNTTAKQVVTLTPNPQNGQQLVPTAYYFNPNTNELSTGKISVEDSLQNLNTGVNQAASWNLNFFYRKKR